MTLRYAVPSVLLIAVLAAVVLCWLARRAGWARPAVRRTACTGGALAVVLLLAQAVLVGVVLSSGRPPRADRLALRWFVEHRDDGATGFAVVLAALGGTASMTVLAVTTVLVLGYLRRWEQAVVVAVTAAGGGLLVVGFKLFYARQRPPVADQVIHYGGYSLPSGHTLGSLVVIGVVTSVACSAARSASSRYVLVAGAALIVLAVGVSRMYLAAHWLTDVLTGWLFGGAWLAVAVTVLTLLSVPGGTRNAAAEPSHGPVRAADR